MDGERPTRWPKLEAEHVRRGDSWREFRLWPDSFSIDNHNGRVDNSDSEKTLTCPESKLPYRKFAVYWAVSQYECNAPPPTRRTLQNANYTRHNESTTFAIPTTRLLSRSNVWTSLSLGVLAAFRFQS